MPMLIQAFGDDVVEVFPYKADENGWCEKLIDNRCSVYDDRPLFCNVEEMWKISENPKDEYYTENIKACNAMMDEDNVPINYRINESRNQTRKEPEESATRPGDGSADN